MGDTLKREFERAVENMVSEDHYNEDMKYIAETCGNGVAVALIKNCGGMTVVIPKRADAKIVKRFVIRHFARGHVNQLAHACGISQRSVYEIVHAEDKRRKATTAERKV